AALLALGATLHGAMPSRSSTRANQGARPGSSNPFSPYADCQCASVVTGVRNELVQLTVVPPPTHRPCRMLIALSAVLRAADSWYRSRYASASQILKSVDDFSGPSSTISTRRPASARISAAMPPPAP